MSVLFSDFFLLTGQKGKAIAISMTISTAMTISMTISKAISKAISMAMTKTIIALIKNKNPLILYTKIKFL